MNWHYQIIKYRDTDTYGLHEVYNVESATSWTLKPITFVGNSPEEIKQALELALKDCDRGVMNE